MNCPRQSDLAFGNSRVPGFAPPPSLTEAGWDILMALRSKSRGLNPQKLRSMVSVSATVIGRWLSSLEDRRFITGVEDEITGEIRALLTPGGLELIDRYLSAVAEFQGAALQLEIRR